MAGTGIHGYTGTSANGLYNISNGIIQSSAPSTNANDVSHYGSSIINGISNAVSNATTAINSGVASGLAQGVANVASSSPSDYGDYIRQLLAASEQNTATSQAFAREQMDYQTRSDQAAMAWSAQEAAKNRAWQESLADTAHQREVRDLLAAGLNPILSSNAGAFTGSGATGQGFSSSGSMGNVDTAGTAALGSLFSTAINTASQAAIAGMYVNAEKYSADLQYSASKMATEASVLNNQNTNTANKEMAANALRADLEKAGITASATRYAADKNLAAAGATAGAMKYSADQSAAASRYSADMSYKGKELDAQTQLALQQNNILQDPAGYTMGALEKGLDFIEDKTGVDIPHSFPEMRQNMDDAKHGASHRF